MSYNNFQSTSNNNQSQATQRPLRTILNFDQDDEVIDTSAREFLLKESGHLTRSEQLLDEQYDIAIKARENLTNQRWSIKAIQEGYNNVTQRFAPINTLVKKIRIRRRRDTIIIAIVFSICLGFLLYSLFT